MSSRVTLDLHQHNETHGEKAAWLLAREGDDVVHARWIPKSLGEKLADGKFSIERWKANEAGFLIPRGSGQGRLEF